MPPYFEEHLFFIISSNMVRVFKRIFSHLVNVTIDLNTYKESWLHL